MSDDADMTDRERLALLRDAIDELTPRLVGDLDVLAHIDDADARLAMVRRVVQHAATLRSATWNIVRIANSEMGRLERALAREDQ